MDKQILVCTNNELFNNKNDKTFMHTTAQIDG